MRFFRQFQHLVPFSEAWRTTLEKTLRKFFEGLADGTQEPAVAFVDDAYLQLFPDTTDQLDEWETQFFGQPRDGLLEPDRRTLLAARWQTLGGQSPRYIQDILQAAGFDLYVHEWWIGDLVAYAYSTQSLDLSSGGAQPSGIYLRLDGTQFFTVSNGADEVQTWNLATPFDLSSGSTVPGASADISGQATSAVGVEFKPDGTKFYVANSVDDSVYEYDLATPWDLNTASYSGNAFAFGVTESSPTDLRFNNDGTKLFISGSAFGGDVNQFSLSTPYAIATSVADGISLDISGQDAFPSGFTFADSGHSIWVVGGVNDTLYKYTMNVAFDIQNAAFDSSLSVAAQSTAPTGVAAGGCSTDKNLYVIDNAADVFQYWRGQSKDPRTYTNQPLLGTTQCGDDGSAPDTPIAECGEQPPNQQSTLSATCNAFLVNDVGYLVNENLTPNAPPPVPDDPAKWPYFLYIGGQTFPDPADVSETLRNEFEDLILRIAPAQQWIVTLIDFTDPVGGGAFGYTFAFDLPA